MPALRVQLVLLLYGCCAAGTVCAQTATFTLTNAQITKDNFVSSAAPAGNFGGTGSLEVSDPSLSKGQFDSVIQFDIMPAYTYFNSLYGVNQWDLLEAKISLTLVNTNNAIFNSNSAGTLHVAHLANDVWTEGGGNPMNPNVPGLTFNDLAALTAGETSVGSFNLTNVATGATHELSLSLAESLLLDLETGAFASFHLSASDGGSFLFASRSNMSGQPRLFLSAQAVPEPSSMILALAGGVACYLRRKQKLRPIDTSSA